MALSFGRISSVLGIDTVFKFSTWSSTFFQINLLLVRSHRAEIIIVERLIQEHNNVTRVRVEPSSCDHGRQENNLRSRSFFWAIKSNDISLSRERQSLFRLSYFLVNIFKYLLIWLALASGGLNSMLWLSNRTQSCHLLAIVATFGKKEPCSLGAMTRNWYRKLVTRSRLGAI